MQVFVLSVNLILRTVQDKRENDNMKDKKTNPMGEWWKRMGEKPHGRNKFTKTDRQVAKKEIRQELQEIGARFENSLYSDASN